MRSPLRLPTAAIAALLAGAASSAHAAPACTLTVRTDADLVAQRPFNALAAGSTVCIAPGTYRQQLTIAGAKGTAATPISFVVQPAGGAALFTGGVLLRASAYVTVSGLDVTLDPRQGPGAAVVIDVGATGNVVRELTVHGAYVGISIGSSEGPAGAGNQVRDNAVRDNWNTGIAVGELTDGTPQDLNVIERNRVSGSGGHGIEINDANWIAVRDNIVTGNGTGVNSVRQGGYSGIHLYARQQTTLASPHGLRTAHDIVSGNRVDGTRERSALSPCDDGGGAGVCADGNGIQVDRFASLNEVVGNTVTGNAGCGISVYGASGNLIKDNVAKGNNQQEGRRRYFPGPGEITLSAVNLPPGSTSGNTVIGNTAITTVYKIPAFYLSANAGINHIDPGNRWQQDARSTPDGSWGPVYVGKTWYSQASALRAYAELSR